MLCLVYKKTRLILDYLGDRHSKVDWFYLTLSIYFIFLAAFSLLLSYTSSDWRILDFVMVTPLVGDFVIGPRPLLFFALTNIFLCKHPLIKRPPERKNNLETLKEKIVKKLYVRTRKLIWFIKVVVNLRQNFEVLANI